MNKQLYVTDGIDNTVAHKTFNKNLPNEWMNEQMSELLG
jgi:hypothetical protein